MLVLQVQQAPAGLPVLQVQQVLQVYLVPQVVLDHRAMLVLQVQQAPLVLLVQMEQQAQQVPVELQVPVE